LHRSLGGRMNRVLIFVALVSVGAGAAEKVDPRLATMRKAYVVASDELGDDKPVAVCLSDRLATATPMALASREDADVILQVSAKIHRLDGAKEGATLYFTRNHASLSASLPDGSPLWTGTLSLGRLRTGVTCGLADGLLTELRNAMRKARDKK
jgi:hypothetical protein